MNLNTVRQNRIKEYVIPSVLTWIVEDTWKDQAVEGVQNKPPWDVPLWHVNYFELKVIETVQAHRKLWLLPSLRFSALPIVGVTIRDNFLWPVYRVGQTSNHWTSALSSETPVCLTSSLVQNATSLIFTFCLSCMWASYIFICNSTWLLFLCSLFHVNWLFDQQEEPNLGE